MFLKQVYRHNKFLFVLLLLFLSGQLFFNFKTGILYSPGVTASPFYLYGMYANQYPVHSSYAVTEVIANGKLLQGKDYTPQQWDKILLPIKFYSNLPGSNSIYQSHITKWIGKTNEINYVQLCNDSAFINWYSLYLSSIIGKQVETVEVREQIYLQRNHVLIATDSIIPLAHLCN